MIYILISLFFIVFAISLFEERLQKYKSVLYISLCIILVFCAAFKPVGFDNDSEQSSISSLIMTIHMFLLV